MRNNPIPQLLLAFCLSIVGSGCGERPKVVLGIISPRLPDLLKEAYRPLEEYLESETGADVRLEPVVKYEDGLARMKAGSWDLAFATNQTYLEARASGYRVLCMVTEHGQPFYHSVIVVPRESAIKTLDDLRHKRIAFVSKKSASGYIYPMKILLDHGFSPASEMKISFTGNAAIIGNTIANPAADSTIRFDAGAVYEGFMTEEAEAASKLRVLAKSVPIPHIPVVAAPRLLENTQLLTRFRTAFLSAKAKSPHVFEPKDVFFDGFEPPNESLYLQVQEVEAQVARYEKQHPVAEGKP